MADRLALQKIDVLVNNAGVWMNEAKETEDGFEVTWQVNHLAPFLLTQRLLPALLERADARVINISSSGHRSGRIHFDDVNMRRGFNGLRAYCQSKLANVLFTQELARRTQGSSLITHAVDPGAVQTQLLAKTGIQRARGKARGGNGGEVVGGCLGSRGSGQQWRLLHNNFVISGSESAMTARRIERSIDENNVVAGLAKSSEANAAAAEVVETSATVRRRSKKAPSRVESLSQSDTVPRFDTLLLAILAASTLAMVRVEAAWHRGVTMAWIIGELAVAIVLCVLVRRFDVVRAHAQKYATAYVLGAASVPFAIAFVSRALGSHSAPYEIAMLVSMQFAALALAILPHVRRLGGTSVLLSAFLLLFSMTISTSYVVLVLAGIFGVVGLWWLMVAYWNRIHVAFAASHVEQCIPMRSAVIGTSGLIAICVAGIVGTTGASTYVLDGFMPTSGGNEWSDESARSGVGDGDAMVAAQDEAFSFGPVESDLFLDSDMPSLYDMFDDTYGEPPRPQKNQQKAISLAYEERPATERQIAKTERNGREFSALRRKVELKREQLDDRKAPAMLYVIGETPLHLGMESYDHFDGHKWQHITKWAAPATPEVRSRFGKPWVAVRNWTSPVHRGTNCYGLKVINLRTNRVPSPAHLTEVHIDKVDRSDFFGWTPDGMLHMPGQDHIPQLTVMHMHSRDVNLHSLRTSYDFTQYFGDEHADKLKPYLECATNHRDVAERWTADVPRGWLQVEAVLHRLRHGFQHDRDAVAPEFCDDVVGHFLQEGTGPDYLFASTAVELLRSLGYPSRLVSGFYADPARFDHRARQTTILASDVHVWAEVCVDGRTWVTVEPTPGYQPPGEQLTTAQWAKLVFWRSVGWCRRHLVGIGCVAAGLVLLVLLRRAWLDVAGRLVCWLFGLRSAHARLTWTIRLLEWRAWLAGRSRAPQKTIAGWYSPLLTSASDEQRPALKSFFEWTDRMLYSRRAIDTVNSSEVHRACSAVVATCERKFILNALPAQ